jgi:GNAT superfamily N-acetyltransferase
VNSEFVRRTQIGAQRAGDYAIRRPCSTDREAIREFLAGLSPRASYLRFFVGAPPASQTMLRLLAGGNASTDVLVAADEDVIIGHAMAADRTGPGGPLTEIGVVVADGYRGLGVGSALVRQLVDRAELRGVTAVVMEVLAENRQVLRMIADHWPVADQDRAGAYVTFRAPLRPVERPVPGERPWVRGAGKEAVAAAAR